MARRSQATTIVDVARHAGVSPATVSRVMNGRFLGEAEVADRVRAAASSLAYSPSPLARGLALGETKTVAFVVPDLANPAFQAVLSSLSKAASRDGYRVLVADSAETPADEPGIASELRRRCDSIVLCAPRMSDAELESIAPSLAPMVLINRSGMTAHAPSLGIDYGAGILELARHLRRLGHTELVYVEGPETSASNARRLEALERFAAEAGDVTVRRLPGGVGIEDGRAAAAAVRDSGASAALAYNDLVAIGLVRALAELGVSVPGAISVTGFDDIPFAGMLSPSLTTASVPHEQLGGEAWSRLSALIGGEQPAEDLVFQPRLELRDSTASVAKAPVATSAQP